MPQLPLTYNSRACMMVGPCVTQSISPIIFCTYFEYGPKQGTPLWGPGRDAAEIRQKTVRRASLWGEEEDPSVILSGSWLGPGEQRTLLCSRTLCSCRTLWRKIIQRGEMKCYEKKMFACLGRGWHKKSIIYLWALHIQMLGAGVPGATPCHPAKRGRNKSERK